MNGWRLPLRMAARELRGGLQGLRVLLACLILGVATIAGVASLASALDAGLRANGRSLLGGDVEFRLNEMRLSTDQEAFLARQGKLSEVRELRGMLRSLDERQRVAIEARAVDQAYPLYGAVRLDPPMPIAEALAVKDGRPGLVADAAALTRLGLKPGDRVRFGESVFDLRAVLVSAPDMAATPIQLGPPVLVARGALAGAGLEAQGTLAVSIARLKLSSPATAQSVEAAVQAAFPDADWRVRTPNEAAPSLRRFIERAGLFMTLIGLSALLVGGVGIGNGVSAWLAARAETIATLKSLGASSRLIFSTYLLALAAVTALGLVIGLALGAAIPFAAFALVGDSLPAPPQLGLYPRALAEAGAAGALTVLLFSLWPLARARGIQAAALFRARIEGLPGRPGGLDLIASGIVALALVAVAVLSAQGQGGDRELALWFAAIAAASLLLFRVMGVAVVRLARLGEATKGEGRRSPSLRLALSGLGRSGSPAPAAILSLGLSLTVLVTIALVQSSLSHEIEASAPSRAPTAFFIDLQSDQMAEFRRIAGGTPGIGELHDMPSLRTRIVALKGVPVDKAPMEPASRSLVSGERGLTYSAALPGGSSVVAGQWWPSDYAGPALVSLDEGLARGLHLQIGDDITYSVAGRELTARLANTRRIDWTSFGINFFSVFAPGTLEAAPQTHLATVRADGDAAEDALERQVAAAFPNVSAIRVKDVLGIVADILGKLDTVILAMGLLALAMSALVLAGAIAAGQRRRLYETVVLKVLGATRRRLTVVFLIEYGLLGLAAGLLAALLGTGAAWALVERLMQGAWHFDGIRVGAVVVLGILLSLLLGFAGTWRALGQRPAPFLQDK